MFLFIFSGSMCVQYLIFVFVFLKAMVKLKVQKKYSIHCVVLVGLNICKLSVFSKVKETISKFFHVVLHLHKNIALLNGFLLYISLLRCSRTVVNKARTNLHIHPHVSSGSLSPASPSPHQRRGRKPLRWNSCIAEQFWSWHEFLNLNPTGKNEFSSE